MSFFDSLRYRWRVLRDPEAHARELEDEIRLHLSLEAMQREHAGRGAVSAGDASHAARRRFGNVTNTKEEARMTAGLTWLDTTTQDLRFALRAFRRTPGFTAVAVLTLAIGIGANTAIFSAVNAMLLRPLPFREPERLMALNLARPAMGSEPARDALPWSYPKFATMREAQTVFSDVALSMEYQGTFTGGEGPERFADEIVGARYLPLLGIQPALGRNFLPDEDVTPGTAHVAILTDALWKREFNADPAVLGRSIPIDGEPYTVVGVLPPGFRGLSGRADMLLPVMSLPADMLSQAWSHSFNVTARLKPGVTPAQAKEAVKGYGAILDKQYADPMVTTLHWSAVARELDATRADPVVRRSLLVLLAAVGLVLLAACANVANLFLIRASGRRREIAVRLAIGAGRSRLVRQLLTESLLLSFAGGAAGIAVAWWGVRILAALDPTTTLHLNAETGIGAVNFSTISLDGTALAFAALLAVVTGLMFGLVPALQSTRPALSGALKGEAPRAERRWLTSRNTLAVAEIAISLVLLAGSGLMVRSLERLLSVNAGFDASQLLTMRFNAPAAASKDSLPNFYDGMIQRLSALPGVTAVGLTDCPPLNGGCNITIAGLRDRPPVAQGSEPLVGVHWITPQWTTAARVPLVAGRLFTEQDRAGAPKVVLVNETAARRLWPGEDPIGKPVSVGQGGFWKDTAQVVGVIGDVRYVTLDSLPEPAVYLSYYQSMRGRMMVFVRTSGDPLALASAARQVTHQMNPDAPLYDLRTMASRVSDATAAMRFRALLLALFAAMALALATMGTYGVISFAVSQRTREIGVRIALGAKRGDVIRLIVRQGVGVAVVGAAIGLAGALIATRVLGSLLYDVKPSDPATFLGIVAVLVGAVLVASWVPARRAARIEPTEALRAE
jgi:predicted permease